MFERLCSWENLLLAYHRASQHKRGRPEIASVEHRVEETLLELMAALRDRSYRPQGYVSFHIHEPKRRLISAAPFRDRIVHHALCNLTEPVIERSLVFDSYANRVGKGTHRALDRAQGFARRFAYVLACDVRQFFPSIDHEVLRAQFRRMFHDEGVQWLADCILDSGRGVQGCEYRMVYFPGDDLLAAARPRGLPIGNLTSQLWANLYLSPVDHFIKRELRCAGYVRYVDDLLLFANDKRTLWIWRDAIAQRMADLRLTMHPGAAHRPVNEGVSFLGFHVFPKHRRIKNRKAVHFQRRLRAMLADVGNGDEPGARARLRACVGGFVNHSRYANTTGLRKTLLGKLGLNEDGSCHG